MQCSSCCVNWLGLCPAAAIWATFNAKVNLKVTEHQDFFISWGLADFLIQSPLLTLTFCQTKNVCLHLPQVSNVCLHLSYILCPLILYFINAQTFHHSSEQPRFFRNFGLKTLKIFWKAKQKAIPTSPIKLPHLNTLLLHKAVALIYSYFIFTHYSSWRFLSICTSIDQT